MKILITFLLLIVIALGCRLTAQVVIINNGSTADYSAMLEVDSNNKGLLIPQISLTGVNDEVTISSPASSLLVYNTNTVSGLTPGYYYNSGTSTAPEWTRLTSSVHDGSETNLNAGANISITGSGTTESPYVINSREHYIGENFGGGKVFHVYEDGKHGLIAATEDQSTGIQWWNGSFMDTYAVTDGIVAGLMNTEIIIFNQGQGDYAAFECATYAANNFGDWYLPSKQELSLLYTQREVVGGFVNDYYWSSTERFDDSAYCNDFSTGNPETTQYKHIEYRVRAIRAF